LCGLRCGAQAQLKFDPVWIARPTCQVVFVVRNTGPSKWVPPRRVHSAADGPATALIATVCHPAC
jgi:hypothetical protein